MYFSKMSHPYSSSNLQYRYLNLIKFPTYVTKYKVDKTLSYPNLSTPTNSLFFLLLFLNPLRTQSQFILFSSSCLIYSLNTKPILSKSFHHFFLNLTIQKYLETNFKSILYFLLLLLLLLLPQYSIILLHHHHLLSN